MNFFLCYAHSRFLPILLFGFLSALPIPLIGSILTAWLAECSISKLMIGSLALFDCPFALKPFFWPIINRLSIPWLTTKLGRRRSWALISFMGAATTLALAALITPDYLFLFYSLIGITSAFSGAIYLIGIAYEIESIPSEQYAAGSACVVFGYRLGLLTSGAGTLFLAHYYSWTTAYLLIALFIFLGGLLLMLAPEPLYTKPVEALADHQQRGWKKWISLLKEDLFYPALELFKKPEWHWIVMFLLFYRASDNLIENMINPYYLSLGFTKTDIAYVAKVYGMAVTIAGSFAGGAFITMMGLERALISLGIVHAGRFLLCLSMLYVGPNASLFVMTELFQHFSGGMIMTAFIATLWKLTTTGKAAPQYALLWSALSLKSKLFAFIGGMIAHLFGWETLFIVAIVVACLSSGLPLFLTTLQDKKAAKA